MSEINFLWELLISSLRPNVSLHGYLYGVFFSIHQVWKKSMDCLQSIALVIGENVCEIKRQIQNMKHGGRGHDQRNRWERKCAAAVLGWVQVNKNGQKTSCRCDTSSRWRDVRGRKKTKSLPKWTPLLLLFFSFPLCPSFLSLLLVFLVVWASDSCALF